MEFLLEIDRSVFLLFNARLTHPALDAVMPVITHFKFWAIPVIIASALFIALAKEKKKAVAVLVLTAVAIGVSDLVSSHIFKPLVARPRPCHPDFLVEGGRYLLGLRGSLTSFPSSHSANMFAGATLLFCFFSKIKYGACFFSFAALIAYTRVYCGVHYPIDVTAGATLGILIGWGVYRIYLKFSRRDTIMYIRGISKKLFNAECGMRNENHRVYRGRCQNRQFSMCSF